MSTPANANPYFNVNTNYLSEYQKNMYAEAIQMFGYDCIYIPISFVEGDINYVFGEVNKVHYTKSFNIRMYVNQYDEIVKAFNTYIKFGILILPESIEFNVSKQDYESIIKESINGVCTVISPKVGDLIYFRIHNESVLFETTHMNFLFDSYYSFQIRLYNYNATNTINTGISDIDSVDSSQATTVDQNLEIENANDEYQNTTKRHDIWGDF